MVGYLDDPEASRRRSTPTAGCAPATSDSRRRGQPGSPTASGDMYICGGFSVYPAEIEQGTGPPDGVADVAVIGVPDERLGEVGHAFVVRKPGSTWTGR